jgi:hypothetical protein
MIVMDKQSLFFFCMMIIITFCLSSFTVSCAGKSPGKILAITDHLPQVDGTINLDEYNMTIDSGKMILHLSRNNDQFFFGLTGRTMGWSSVGFGGMGMDKSHIIIGYADNGSHVVAEHTGKGHSHNPTQKETLLSSMIIDQDGNTTFEGSVKAGDIIGADQKTLSLIIACGNKDNFTSRHIFRKSLVIKLKSVIR